MSPTKATKKPAPKKAAPPAKKVSSETSKAPAPAAKKPSADGSKVAASAAPVPVAREPQAAAPAEQLEAAVNEAPAAEHAEGEAKHAEGEAKKDKAPSAIERLAQELIVANDAQSVLRHVAALEDEREGPSTQAARLVSELTDKKPELLVPLIERFARLLVAKNRRVVMSAASALAPLSRIAPAKVAKQLPVLTQNWDGTTDDGKDGLVRTFAGLCTASVAYQKRLEPALARALGEAEPKLLIRWTEIVLPALKGEPHARARAVVEDRLYAIPRPQAQKIADFLGIKLRPVMRT
jgi:hypothetical protein